MKRIAFAALVLAGLAGGSAHAQDGAGNCTTALQLSNSLNPSVATVSSSAPRTQLIKSRSDSKACPSASAACASKAYVVPNDEVFTGQAFGDFICATLVNAKGRATSGWLPKASITIKPATPVALADWLGTWSTGIEHEIRISRGKKAGTLALDAMATFGAKDPDRVKRGAVNMGDFKAERAPKDAFLEFTVGPKGTLAYSEGDTSDCKVQLLRVGNALVVEDNGQCGGMNVSFSGLYRRQK